MLFDQIFKLWYEIVILLIEPLIKWVVFKEGVVIYADHWMSHKTKHRLVLLQQEIKYRFFK